MSSGEAKNALKKKKMPRHEKDRKACLVRGRQAAHDVRPKAWV